MISCRNRRVFVNKSGPNPWELIHSYHVSRNAWGWEVDGCERQRDIRKVDRKEDGWWSGEH